MKNDLIQFLVDNSQLFVILFSGVSSSVAAIALIVSILNNIKADRRYRSGQTPQLSMKLERFDNDLYLLVKNTGNSAAISIMITINNIANNGSYNSNDTRILFNGNFDLYPNEEVQDFVAFYGSNITIDVFPIIDISVEYKDTSKKEYKYSRKVTYCKAYNNKIYADINLDTQEIEKNLKSISRTTTRMANYLDGKNLASFDDIDVLSNRSLQNDLYNAINTTQKEIVLNRDETLNEALSARNNSENK